MGRCKARSRWEPELAALNRLELPSVSSVRVEDKGNSLHSSSWDPCLTALR